MFLFILIGGLNRLELFDPLNQVSFSREVYDRNGKLLRLTLSDDEQFRIYRKLNDIPEDLQHSVLLTEDRYFYYHWGINPVSLVRALASLNQQRPVGASTITMQMVRLRDKLYTKSVGGKLKQIFYALQAELIYSKRQILEAYLNLTPYGANIEGVGAAARIYFNKEPNLLSLGEILNLAVIPQNPLKRNLENHDTSAVFKARDRLYDAWVEKNPDSRQFKKEIQLPMLKNKISELPFKAPHFVNYILDENSEKKVFHTTLDMRLQSLIEKKINGYLATIQSKGIDNAAAILIDSNTNEIKAWVGSADFFSSEILGQNDGVVAKRSPGSALKPFLYGLAMDEGLIHPQSLLFDTPSSFGSYDPENFDLAYKGPITAEQALIQSRNVPAIYLASRLKQKSLYQLLRQAQVIYPFNEKYYGLAIALGSAEVSMKDLAGLYSSLAHRGDWFPLKWDAEKKEKPRKEKIISEESAFMLLDILKKNPQAESEMLDQASKEKVAVAWKTGTSYGYHDAWTAGLIGDHVLVVWLGNFNNSENPALIGRDIAAPLFFDIGHTLKAKGFIKDAQWDYPIGLKLKSVDVCALTGQFPNENCPHKKKTWFNPGVSSIEECQVHREILISKTTGKRLCHIHSQAEFKREIFEFWPSDVVQLFQKYGIPYKKTPNFEGECAAEFLTDTEIGAPEIVSPKYEVKYAVRFEQKNGYDKIPLKAKVDQDVKKVYWFANAKPLGETSASETMFVELTPGHYEITVVDDHGQSVSRNIQVEVL